MYVFSILALHEKIKLVNILRGEIETRELKATLRDLRQVIEANTRAIFEIVQTQMRVGAVPYDEQAQIYDNLTRVLESAEFKPEEIANIQARWHYWVDGDYVRAIFVHFNICHPLIPKERLDEWYKVRGEYVSRAASLQPQELKNILEKFGAYTSEAKLAIEDFEYYKKNRKHRDVERWKRHHEWFKK